MEPSFFTREIVNDLLDELVHPSHYIKYFTFFYSEEYKINIRDKKYHTVFLNAVFDPKFRLINSMLIMEKEIAHLMSTSNGNNIAVFIDALKHDYKTNKAKFNQDKILKEIEEYNEQEIQYERKQEDDPLFLVDTANLNIYFESINTNFKNYEEVVLRYITMYESGNLNTNAIINERTVTERFDYHIENWAEERGLHLSKNELKRSFRFKSDRLILSPSFEAMKNKLQENFIDKSTTLTQLRNIFKGKPVINKVKWVGTAPELSYFVKTISPILDNRIPKWRASVECLEHNYSYDSLRKYKDNEVSPENRTLINKSCENILREYNNI